MAFYYLIASTFNDSKALKKGQGASANVPVTVHSTRPRATGSISYLGEVWLTFSPQVATAARNLKATQTTTKVKPVACVGEHKRSFKRNEHAYLRC